MQYVIVRIETDSDVPGVDGVLGPFPTYEDARAARDELREANPFIADLIQVSAISAPLRAADEEGGLL